MIGDVYIRIKVRENEHDVLGPYTNEAQATAELRKRPRAHLAKGGSIEGELLVTQKAFEIGRDGQLRVVDKTLSL